MIMKGHLTPSTAPGCMPILMVPKVGVGPDKKPRYRLVADFSELNEKCIKTGQPLPSIERIFDNLTGKGNVFTLIDLTDGFHNCPLAKESQKHTAIVTPFGEYEFKVLPQGFTNSPGEFQQRVSTLIMEAQRTGLIDPTVKIFIDDIIITGINLQTLLIASQDVLQLLHDNGLQILPRKCHFGATRISFLGFTLSKGGRSLGETTVANIKKKIEEILLFYINPVNHLPTAPKLWVQMILGILTFYRQFIHEFTTKTEFLTRKLKKDAPTTLTEEDVIQIHRLIEDLTSSGCIAIIDPNIPTQIFTDASAIWCRICRYSTRKDC